jgi:hypothetical protein
MTVHSSDDSRSRSSVTPAISWRDIGRQFIDGLRLRWDQGWYSKATWRCTAEELPPGAHELILMAVGGVSRPLVGVKAAQETAEADKSSKYDS